MPSQVKIEKSDYKAAEKLLGLIGLDELVINNASQETDNQKTIIRGNVSLFSQNNLAATITEYQKDSLVLNVNIPASSISLSDLSSLLNLDNTFSSLYSQVGISNFNLSVSTSSQDNSNYDCLVIQGGVAISNDQDFLPIDNFSITNITLSVSIRNATSFGNKDIKVILRAFAKLDDKDLQVIFALPVGSNSLWQIKLIAPGLDFSFQKLAALTMGSAVFSQLPTQISSIPGFSLSALEINFNPTAPSNKLHDISFEIQSDGTWVLIPDSILIIKNISLSALVSGSSAYQGSVNAVASIDNELDVNISIPIPISSGALSFYSNNVFQLNDLTVFSSLLSGTGFGDFLSSVKFGDSFSMGVESLSIDLDLSSKSVSAFSIDGQASFCTTFIGSVLELDARLSVTYDKSQSEGQTFGFTLDAQAKLLVSGETFNLEGKYDSREKIWSFNGNASGPISLANITESFGISNRYLPASISNLSISDIYADFSTAAGNPCSFNCKTTIPLSGTNYEFAIAINKTGSNDWTLNAESNFSQPLLLNNIINSLLSLFDITATLPSSIQSLNIGLSKISFSYDSSTHGIDFEFTLSTPLAYQTITGSDITPGKTSPQNFSSFKLLKSNSDGNKDMKLVLTIEPGLKLKDFLGDVLPIPPDTTLEELDFTLDISSSSATSSSKYSFATSFSDSGDSSNVVKITGVLDKEIAQDKTVTYFGGSLSSDSKISLTGDSPISMSIKDLFIAKITSTPSGSGTPVKTTVFGSDLSVHADIDLSSLPVVGDFLKEAKFSFDSLRIAHSSAAIQADELTNINAFLSKINVAPLVVAQNTVANGSATPASFPAGFSIQGTLILGDNAEVIPLHSSIQQGGQNTNPSQTINVGNTGQAGTGNTPPPQASSNPTPSPVGKKFGPVTIESVSLGLKNGNVDFTFTGGLLIGPLNLEFIGFEVTSPVNSFNPSVSLQGFGVGINKPPLTLQGLFLVSTIDIPTTDSSGNITTVPIIGYNGSLSVGYKNYALTAMGSYAKLPDGATTIFLYGFLGASLGGLPAILYITGVAAGFGYNRAFTLPTPETINTYPLIQPVIPTTNTNTTLFDFNALNLDFMPQEGAFWGAIGIRVESFKMMESFVLLAVQFDGELEIDILGLSTMQFPVSVDVQGPRPLAKIIIGLVARILPERGIVAVNGAFLTGSYIYVSEAQITGGFAMLSIFKDQADGQWAGGKEGDFIFTLGGYGPLYTPQSYYPQVPRLEMNWKVNDNLYIKADAYFAITPQAMMVGGQMVANYQAGGSFSIHVNFTVGADFIIYWKPYRYLGHMYADLNVTASINLDCWLFTIHASVDFDLSADLKIWGPKFSGYASVHVHVLVSFTVGISFGDPETTPAPISWSEFSNGFLPLPAKMVTSNIGSGLIASQSSANYNVVNAKELSIVCGTAIALKTVTVNNLPLSVNVGSTVTLTYSESGGTWSSSNNNVATVNQSTGVVAGISIGVAQIIYSVNNEEYTAEIIVTNTGFGIKPMANTATDFSGSALTVTISKGGTALSNDLLAKHFIFEPIIKNMPAALWEPAESSGVIPGNDGGSLINGLLNGIKISAHPADLSPDSYVIPANEEDDINTVPSSFVAQFSYSTTGFTRNTNS